MNLYLILFLHFETRKYICSRVEWKVCSVEYAENYLFRLTWVIWIGVCACSKDAHFRSDQSTYAPEDTSDRVKEKRP